MEKLNIAEILKDCPKGMELDCTMYDNLYFDSLNVDYYGTINCYTLINGVKTSINFTKYGTFNNHPGAKCVIYPKGKTTWEGSQRPFKDGDVVISIYNDIHLLRTADSSYCAYREAWEALPKFDNTITTGVKVVRFATEEEKQKLFDAIKANGYRWNAETKTLEKLIEPKFKVGDKIKNKASNNIYTITDIRKDEYIVKWDNDKFSYHLAFCNEIDYELVPNKFDITTLKPFESRVLVRTNNIKWIAAFYSHYDENSRLHHCVCGGLWFEQCIPYNDETKHLLDTTNDCDKYYKTWE